MLSRDEALNALRNELFSRSDIVALPLIIIPTLVHRPNFPSIRYIELIDCNPTFSVDSVLYEKWTLHQLHAFLLILDNRIDEIPASLIKTIVSIIRYFISSVLNRGNSYKISTQNNDLDEQDNDEKMDVEVRGNGNESDYELIEDCLAILNKRSITNYCLKLANRNSSALIEEDTEYIADLAAIAHNLIVHQRGLILPSQ